MNPPREFMCRCGVLLHHTEDNNLSPLQLLVNKSHKCVTCNKCWECKELFGENDVIQHCDTCEALFHHGGCEHNHVKGNNTLRCLQWNVRKMNNLARIGLSRVDILRDLLSGDDIDIVFLQDLQESGFKKIHFENNLVFPNYRIIPNNKEFKVHFLIKNGLELVSFVEETNLENYVETDYFEHSKTDNNHKLRIKIRRNNRSSITRRPVSRTDGLLLLTNFYCPPSDVFKTQHLPGQEYGIVAGDFNAHSTDWDIDYNLNSYYAIQRGNHLVTWKNTNHYICVNDNTEKTYRKEYVESFLTTPDITFFNNRLSADIDFRPASTRWRVIPMRIDHYVIKFDIVFGDQTIGLANRCRDMNLNLYKKTSRDSNCQFDSVARSEKVKMTHPKLRKSVVKFLETLKFDIEYLKRMRKDEWGDEKTLQAMSYILNRHIYVLKSENEDLDYHVYPTLGNRPPVSDETILIAHLSNFYYFAVKRKDNVDYSKFKPPPEEKNEDDDDEEEDDDEEKEEEEDVSDLKEVFGAMHLPESKKNVQKDDSHDE